MKNEDEKSYLSLWILFSLLCGIFWIMLIVLKACDLVSMGWITVLFGIWWIPIDILSIAVATTVLLTILKQIHFKFRRWRVTRRIIRLDKECLPMPIKAKTLDELGREYGIERKPGESDAILHGRIRNYLLREITKEPHGGKKDGRT